MRPNQTEDLKYVALVRCHVHIKSSLADLTSVSNSLLCDAAIVVTSQILALLPDWAIFPRNNRPYPLQVTVAALVFLSIASDREKLVYNQSPDHPPIHCR